MALTGPNMNQIRVAGSGKLLVAPVGTVAPTDTVTAWGATWQDLGFTSDAGVTFSKKDTFDKVPLWQVMVTGRLVPKERVLTFKFDLTQINAVTLPLWGGGGVVATNGATANEYVYSIAENLSSYERALGIEWTDNNGAIIHRLVVPRGQVTDTTDIGLTRTKSASLGITFEAMGLDGTTPLVNFIMKDPNLVP